MGTNPDAIAITPDGTSAYVTNYGSGTVSQISLATGTVVHTITLGSTSKPDGIAINPSGSTAYVATYATNSVTPIVLQWGQPWQPMTAGFGPEGVAIDPAGQFAYVTNNGSNNLSSLPLGPGMPGAPKAVGRGPEGVAITPDGASAYVVNNTDGTVTPVAIPAMTAGTPISVGGGPTAIAITPDQAPLASFTDTPGAAGTATTFDASGSTVKYGSITDYKWVFGDGGTADTPTPTASHVYATAGNYTVTLTETDAAGTSTTQIFTGQTVSRQGASSAQVANPVTVPEPSSSDPSGSTSPGGSPAIVLGTSRITVSRRGVALIPLRCPASAPSGCAGTVTLWVIHKRAHAMLITATAARCARGCRPLGHARYHVAAGHSTRAHVTLSRYGRSLLSRGSRLVVKLAATNTVAGKTTTVVTKLTLVAPGPHIRKF